jgi:hypothetical protein
MDGQFRRMGFSHDLVTMFLVFGHDKSIVEPENSFVIHSKVLGFLLLHFSLDVKYTSISLL